jgi:hypothetical protein
MTTFAQMLDEHNGHELLLSADEPAAFALLFGEPCARRMPWLFGGCTFVVMCREHWNWARFRRADLRRE